MIREIPYARYLLIFFSICLMALTVPVAFVWTVDPLQVFRRQALTVPQFYTQDRFRIAGLIRTYLSDTSLGYEGILLGTSMSQNFKMDDVSKILGWGKTLKMSAEGATPREIRIIAESAISTGNVKHVVWELYLNQLTNKPEDMNKNRLFPYYLFTDDPWDDYQYIFNVDSIEIAIRTLLKQYPTNYETSSRWMGPALKKGAFDKFNSPENISKLATLLNRTKRKQLPSTLSFEEMKYPNIDTHLLPVLSSNPKIEFVVFIPPVTTYAYAKMPKDGFLRALYLRRYLVNQTKEMKNVTIHAFDTEAWLTENIWYYKDKAHFRDSINPVLLEQMRDRRHVLNETNIDVYEQAFSRMVEQLEIVSIPSRNAGK